MIQTIENIVQCNNFSSKSSLFPYSAEISHLCLVIGTTN